MPVFAHLSAAMPCPNCGAELAIGGRIGFQWGYCSNPYSGDGDRYHVRDAIRWRTDPHGNVPAWTYFSDRHGGGNIGDPKYADLLVRESEFALKNCQECEFHFQGIALAIRSGRIANVRVYSEGLTEHDISLIDASGRIVPQPQWDDYPMPMNADGDGGLQLVTFSE